MTEYILKTTKENADEIYLGIKTFDYRYSRDNLKLGDRIQYQVIKDRKRIRHPISNVRYKVNYIDRDVPQIANGVCVIGLVKVV